MKDLDDYHKLIGYLRAEGLSEAAAHYQAEETMMEPVEQNIPAQTGEQ
jgi:hypothetical protein